MEPSGSPSVSMEPSYGKGGKGGSKTAAPSLSMEPSMSSAPSCSLMPSGSFEPSPSPTLTQLTLGDIAFICYNADDADDDVSSIGGGSLCLEDL